MERSQRLAVSMSSTVKPSTWVTLLQDANRERDRWEEACHYWKHKYETLHQAHMHTLMSLLCEACRSSPDRQELCNACSAQWNKST